MGILNLSAYIFNNEELYLKPHKLCDCLLVVDGGYISNALYSSLGRDYFGGEYSLYYARTKSFLSDLKKCNVEPIFLFDGASQPTKLECRLERRNKTVSKISRGKFSKIKCIPLLFMEVFLDVVRDMGFFCIQCNSEADAEIAALAKILNCPVLSYDSDYFIYDASYIPYIKLDKTPKNDSPSGTYYMDCLIYNVEDFLKQLQLDKSLLPLIATILGNDHGTSELFYDFLNSFGIYKKENFLFTPENFLKLIESLKNHTKDSAVELITRFMSDENVRKFSQLLTRNEKCYNDHTLSMSVINELSNRFKLEGVTGKELSLKWPTEITNLCAKTRIPGFIMTMALHQFYIVPMQVENLSDVTPHLKCLKLILKIYQLVYPYASVKKPLTIYLIKNGSYKPVEEPCTYSNICLDDALKEPKEVRLKLLFDAVGIALEEVQFVPLNSWAVFVLSFIYWVKVSKNEIAPAHIHSLVIMAIANQIVETKVNSFKNQNEEVILKQGNEFEKIVEKVKYEECLLLKKKFTRLRIDAGKVYYISVVHSFSCFQTCLFYMMILNSLFNYPLPHLRVGDFYSGVLLFNLYTRIKPQSDVMKFGSYFFEETPNINQIYKYLSERLCKFLD